LFSALAGVAVFFIGIFIANFYVLPILEKKVQRIGYAGSYAIDSISDRILKDVSYGLTKVNERGAVEPGAAYKWEVKDNGRVYVFHIRRGQYFHNGRELTASTLDLEFSDVERTNIDEYTLPRVSQVLAIIK
jgi:ABC-type oligopeptide transport system substrate-binding subunit